MSSPTNICEGDFARQLDILKEEQAKNGTHARGCQALLMTQKHISTSRKHGAVYDIEDLMAVHLVNDDLRGFITRWDAVIAGMTSEPDVLWKQAYFHTAIKNFRPLSSDLAVYDRTPEGEPNRSYEFFMKAARDYLGGKRVEKMRQATKKSLSGKKEAAAAPKGAGAKSIGVWLLDDFEEFLYLLLQSLLTVMGVQMPKAKLLNQLTVVSFLLPEPPEQRDRGEAALREEARAFRHMMTLTLKNHFCETCKCAKMHKPIKRAKGESLTVDAETFGDQITADHLVTRDIEEESIDADKVALILKDVAANFRWVYPSATNHAKDCVLAFKHFVGPGEEVGVFNSDNADAIRLACREELVEKRRPKKIVDDDGEAELEELFRAAGLEDDEIEAADVALFAELGSSPANMEAGKAFDAYGAMPANKTNQADGDGKQAYTQALMQGIFTWIRLPRNRWPKEWIGVYKDPVVLLILALHGHPDSGGLWQRHCEKAFDAVGFHPLYPECWPSMFWHPRF
eukprot:s1156_g47.t1